MNEHEDVAAYALGVLDDRDSSRFEEHLAHCSACAVELESMLPVVDLLSDVDATSLVATEQSERDGVVLHRMISTVGHERKRARSRQMFGLAAAAVLLAALTGGAFVAGGEWLSPEPSGTVAQPAPTPTDKPSDLLPGGGSGIGGPTEPGETFTATDARTGVTATVAFSGTDWGTSVNFAVSRVTGPRTCRLVAVRTNGATEVLSTWTVSEKGYGTEARPAPLTLTAATALKRTDIAYVQVQAIDEATGAATKLVTVPE